MYFEIIILTHFSLFLPQALGCNNTLTICNTNLTVSFKKEFVDQWVQIELHTYRVFKDGYEVKYVDYKIDKIEKPLCILFKSLLSRIQLKNLKKTLHYLYFISLLHVRSKTNLSSECKIKKGALRL